MTHAMNAEATPRYRRRRRGEGACDGAGQGRGWGRGARGQGSLGSRTATRALVAAATYVVQDLRDPDGLTRPMLRRAALRLAASPRKAIRQIGTAYPRSDPPQPDELVVGPEPPRLELPAGAPAKAPGDDVGEADATSARV